MSRRYPVADRYEERERDFYARPRSERNYEELDVDLTRPRYADRAETVVSDRSRPRPGKTPDFLREDYGRTSAGALVPLRGGDRDDWDAYSRRGPPERVEEDKLVIRERDRERRPERPAPREVREVDREEYVYRRGGDPRSREREVDELDIHIRDRDREAPPPPRPRSVVGREEIVFRRGEGDRRRGEAPPPPPRSEVDREEITIRRREETRSPPRRDRDVERDELIIHERERSLPPPRRRSVGPIAREREEFVFRRRESPPEPPPPREEHEEIIIRRRERSLTPEPRREPSPEPLPPPPVVRPPIVQEIITHHRHIDHGVERARSPTPPPPPPSPPRDDTLEIEIRRRGTRNGERYNDDLIIERDRSEHRPEPRRAPPPRGPVVEERDIEITRTRSMSNLKARGPPRKETLRRDMWTEVTKDLVIKEAIEQMGYDFEESENYYYIIEYLQYEDVLQLVELSEDIRRERRERIREIQWERDELERMPPAPPRPKSRYEELVYERDVDYYRRSSGRAR